MITDILPCENCCHVDITAQIPNGKRLCAQCYAPVLNVNPSLLKIEMKKAMIRQAENNVPKRFDTAIVNR